MTFLRKEMTIYHLVSLVWAIDTPSIPASITVGLDTELFVAVVSLVLRES